MKRITILSIDGGGIRGVLPGVVLSYIEEQLQEREGEHVRLSDYFDLIAGTSTGGILTCLYLVPDETGRPKYTAREAVEMYLSNGEDIFHSPWYRNIITLKGLRRSKYPVVSIEKLLDKYMGNTRLSETIKPCLITAYDFVQRKAIFFNKKDTEQGVTRDFLLRDIARSTSAAPTYFKPSKISSIYGDPLFLIDGGMFANNPSMCAYAEARTTNFSKLLNREDKPNKPGMNDMLLISIGTGSKGAPYHYSKVKKWGMVGWLRPIIDILMSGNSETVNYQLKMMFGANCSPGNPCYYRLEPQVGEAKSKMDCATKKNLQALEEAGKSYVARNVAMLNKIVTLLIENK